MTTNQILLELLRSAVLDREPNLPKDVVVNWDELMDISSRQGVLAWVWDGICELPVEQQPPRQQRINWALSAQGIWDRYHKQKEVIADMVRVCEANGMRMLLLKGIGLSELYPKPESRPSGDIDVYFGEKYEEGNNLFGNGNMTISSKHAEFSYHGAKVENHYSLLNHDWRTRIIVENYLLQRLDKSIHTKAGYYIFEPQSHFLYVFFHAMRHMEGYQSSLSLRSILDLPFLLIKESDTLSPSQCFELVDLFNVSYCFELFIYFSEWALGVDFSKYRRSIIPSNDIILAKEMFNQLEFSNQSFSDESFGSFLNSVKHYLKVHKWKSMFLHVNKGERTEMIKLIIHASIKFLFRVPLNEPFLHSFKMKFCK